MDVIRSALSAVRNYRLVGLFFSEDRSVNHDNEYNSPFLSFERMILVRGELGRSRLSGKGHVVYTTQPMFSWMILFELFNLQDTGLALRNWSKWFSATLESGEEMIDQVNTFRTNICEENDSDFDRKRMIGQLKWITDSHQIWWRPLDNIFQNSDHADLDRRYDRIVEIVSAAYGNLPTTALTTLKKIWLLGCEWEELGLLPEIPYTKLNQYIKDGHTEQLEAWATDAKQLASVGQFHRYLRAVIANFELEGCEDRLARLELALEPQLQELFGQKDGRHQRWVADIKGGWPVTVDGTELYYVESLTDCVHRFKGKESDMKRLLVFGEKNGVECYLAQARRKEGLIHYVPKGFGVSYFEIEEVKPINWKEPPANLLDLLKALEEEGVMPEDLATALVKDKKGNACWLPTERRIGFNSGNVMLFLYQADNANAPARITKLDYAGLK